MAKLKYRDTVQDLAGNALSAIAVAVYNTGTLTLSSLFADDGTTPLANPVLTDATGEFEFVVEAGVYDLSVAYPGGAVVQDAVSIGSTAEAVTPYIVVTGLNTPAVASGDRAMALGDAASASGQYAIAIGSGATSTFTSSTALGEGATTTASNQIMLGAATEHVVSPGHHVVKGVLIEQGAPFAGTTIDTALGGLFSRTLAAPVALTFTAPALLAGLTAPVLSFTIEITNSGGAQAITWPVSVSWLDGAMPAPTAGVDVYDFYTRDGGATYYGARRGAVSATQVSAWQVKTANYTAVDGDRIMADTSGGAFTVTLPATPSAGETVTIADYAGTFGTNLLTVARNGSNINGDAEDFILDIPEETRSFDSVDATLGWKVI